MTKKATQTATTLLVNSSDSTSEEIYQNLLTDFGFKYIFRQEEFLIPFLNELLKGKETIKSIKYLNSEHLGKTKEDRSVIFDIYCENEKGEKILLEMQKSYQDYFLERSIYYSSFLIQQQGIKGMWEFHLDAIYVIGVLNFNPIELEKNINPVCRAKIVDIETGEVISEKLNFIYVSLPKFNKPDKGLQTPLDYWLYTLIHSQPDHEMDEDILRSNEFFSKLLDTIRLNKLTPKEMKAYKESKSEFERFAPYMSGHRRQGKLEGIEIGMQKGLQEGLQKGLNITALNALKKGFSAEIVSEITNLSVAKIEELQKQLLGEAHNFVPTDFV
jgi:predicted transposase/invertase (TIGR01784 family)